MGFKKKELIHLGIAFVLYIAIVISLYVEVHELRTITLVLGTIGMCLSVVVILVRVEFDRRQELKRRTEEW